MKHLKKFNENVDGDHPKQLLSDDGDIHDSLLYDFGLSSDLEAYSNMRRNLNVSENELPEDAKALFNEIDSTLESISSDLRMKILKLYTVLTGDTSLNELED